MRPGRGEGREGRRSVNGLAGPMEVAEASARARERRVTDGINHRCDRVRGGKRGRRAVSDGSGWREAGGSGGGGELWGVWAAVGGYGLVGGGRA